MTLRRSIATLALSLLPFASLVAQTPAQSPQTPAPAPQTLSLTRQNPATPAPLPTAPATTDRGNLTFTAYDLELLMRPASAALTARGEITIRNDGATPSTQLPLQISSTLAWSYIRLNGKPLPFHAYALATDLDHTGTADEAIADLPSPLAPGQSVTVSVLFEGTIKLDASRLEHLGAPPEIAERSDWDRISPDFIGLRGFGDVLWYPVCAAPVAFGDGARLFHEVGAWKAREQSATMRLRIRLDTSSDPDSADDSAARTPQLIARSTPNVAIVNASQIALHSDSSAPNSAPAILAAELPAGAIGFAVPSIFIANRSEQREAKFSTYANDIHAAAAQAYHTALTLAQPMLDQWLAQPKRPYMIFDAADPDAFAFESQADWQTTGGALLYAPMADVPPIVDATAVVHTYAHAAFVSPRQWLNEGVAQFMSTLWAEHSGNGGRDAALQMLESQRGALALAEPSDPDTTPGTPLINSVDDIMYRTKSAYVLWMLRDICGDVAFSSVLKNYRAADDASPDYFEKLLEAASHKDLHWFFNDWVYRDRGLADLRINSVFSRFLNAADGWLVTVEVANDGYAAAEVPVTVHSGKQAVTQRVLIPPRTSVTARIIMHGQPDEVTVNDGTVPETAAVIHRRSL
jgi:hypothetical protein